MKAEKASGCRVTRSVHIQHNIAGLVLAGGKSSRMGSNKAFLPFRGIRLVDHMMRTLDFAGATSIWVSGWVPGHASIPDLKPGLGPLGGIDSALDQISGSESSLLIVIPVDMPLLLPEQIKKLYRPLLANKKQQAAYFDGHSLPAVFRINKRLRTELRLLLSERTDKSHRSVHELLRRMNASPIDGDFKCFLNANTPEDWQVILKKESS